MVYYNMLNDFCEVLIMKKPELLAPAGDMNCLKAAARFGAEVSFLGAVGEDGFESIKNLLTPTPKRCPHLGCALKWNKAEHSWDCPCHGSRFTQGGKLLENPAAKNIEKGLPE